MARFLDVYGIKLHAKKSLYVPINVKRTAEKTQDQVGLWQTTKEDEDS